jgi:hypothetical protein
VGIAAYNRGSASIARGIRQEAGTWQEPLTPKPRPATWGSATAERALTRARSILASNRRLGRELDEEILAGAVQQRERCSDATALAAALQALGESSAKPNGRAIAPSLSPAHARLLAHLVARAKVRITDDVRRGVVPRTVRDYGVLHDYVDANMYLLDDAGAFDPAVDAMQVEIPMPYGEIGYDSQPMYDFLNLAQDRLHDWLAKGALGRLPAPRPHAKPNGRSGVLNGPAAYRLGARHGETAARRVVDDLTPAQLTADPRVGWEGRSVADVLLADTRELAVTLLGDDAAAPFTVDDFERSSHRDVLWDAFGKGVASTAASVLERALAGAKRSKANGRRPAPDQSALPFGGVRARPAAPAEPAKPRPAVPRADTLYGVLRDRTGTLLGVLSVGHGGPGADLRALTAHLQAHADREGYAWSSARSQWLATDARGVTVWEVTSDREHVERLVPARHAPDPVGGLLHFLAPRVALAAERTAHGPDVHWAARDRDTAKPNGRRRPVEPEGPSLFEVPRRQATPPPAPSPAEARLDATLRGSSAHRPSTVYGFLRDRPGHPLGVIDAPHDGTVPGIRAAAEALQARADREGWDWSGIQSQWIATGPDGRAGWAISPNLRHIDPVGSDAAAYTLGDLSRAPSRVQPPAPPPAPARAAAPVAATWPDGRQKPRPGDTVWRAVPGLYGRAIVTGQVTPAGRVKAQGRSYPATEAWSVEGDPEVARREAAAAQAAADAQATRAQVIAAAARAVDIAGTRMGLQRIGTAYELAPGDIVYMVSSAGMHGDGDPSAITTKAVRVSRIDEGSLFSYEDEVGTERTSGTVRNWWRTSGPTPSGSKHSKARKAKDNPAQASRVYSAATSGRHVPGLHAALIATGTLLPGSLNVDVGGGKYDDATEALRAVGVQSVVYDPGHRANAPAVLEAVEDGRADSATIANVLNVIPDASVRRQVLKLAANVVKKGGAVYIDCYAGAGRAAGTGRGRKTSRGWQAYRPLASYLGEVRAVLPSARLVTLGTRHVIVARK